MKKFECKILDWIGSLDMPDSLVFLFLSNTIPVGVCVCV